MYIRVAETSSDDANTVDTLDTTDGPSEVETMVGSMEAPNSPTSNFQAPAEATQTPISSSSVESYVETTEESASPSAVETMEEPKEETAEELVSPSVVETTEEPTEELVSPSAVATTEEPARPRYLTLESLQTPEEPENQGLSDSVNTFQNDPSKFSDTGDVGGRKRATFDSPFWMRKKED